MVDGQDSVLVTGASGFVGHALVRRLISEGHAVTAATRSPPGTGLDGCKVVQVGELGRQTDWRAALDGVSHVVHTAARVHVMRETAADPLAEFRRVNVEGTVALAEQAARAGVRRFLFISSIKVNGEATSLGRPFRADDTPRPEDPYGVSKAEAEAALLRMQRAGDFEVTVIRPVLVYGPGVKGNFRLLVRAVTRGVPLPFGAIDNRRSLVGIDNLVDLCVVALHHPAAAGEIFLVSDGEDLSTPELLRRSGQALGRRAHLIPVPSALLLRLASGTGWAAQAKRLVGSLQIDLSPTIETLSWRPPYSVDESLIRMLHEDCAK